MIQHFTRRSLLATGAALATGLARATDFPMRPITLVVPYPAGGAIDVLTRIVGEAMQKSLGQRVLVDNRPGANSMIATQYVLRSAPDGHTLLVNLPAILLNPILMPKAGYDPLTGFVAVTELGVSSSVLSVRSSLPVRNMAEFIEYAKANRGASVASWGPGSTTHIHAAVIASGLGIELRSIPYKGEAPAIQDMVGGVLDAAFISVLASRNLSREGRVRPLAVAGPRRLSPLPEVPTLNEAGVPGSYAPSWVGLFAPAGTPRNAADAVQKAVAAAFSQPAVAARALDSIGFEAGGSPGEIFSSRVANDFATWRNAVRQHRITLE